MGAIIHKAVHLFSSNQFQGLHQVGNDMHHVHHAGVMGHSDQAATGGHVLPNIRQHNSQDVTAAESGAATPAGWRSCFGSGADESNLDSSPILKTRFC